MTLLFEPGEELDFRLTDLRRTLAEYWDVSLVHEVNQALDLIDSGRGELVLLHDSRYLKRTESREFFDSQYYSWLKEAQ